MKIPPDRWQSIAIDYGCMHLWAGALARSLSPLSSPSLHLHGLFLVVGPLVGVFFIVVVIVALPMVAAFDRQFVCVGRLALPRLHWHCLLLGRHACAVVGLNEVCGWVLDEVGCGGMWWEGGGRKTKDNDVATKPTLFVSFRNVPGGMVYEV